MGGNGTAGGALGSFAMSVVQVTARIDAPLEDVWNTIMDPSRLKDWVTIHRAVRDVSTNPLRRGSTMEQTLHLRGVTFRVHWTLVDVSPPNHAEWQGQGPAHSQARIRYELSADDDGATVFDYTNEFTAPGGRLGIAASKVIVGDASEREASNSLARLKALLEKT
jgi:uncharacterized protein YndB with AHSA1/START domain